MRTLFQESKQIEESNLVHNKPDKKSEVLAEHSEGKTFREKNELENDQDGLTELITNDAASVDINLTSIRNELNQLADTVETNPRQYQVSQESKQNNLKEDPTHDSLLSKIKNNKFLRRLFYGSVLVGGMLSSEKAYSQNQADGNGKEKTEYTVDKVESSFLNEQENNMEKIKSEFFELFNKMKQYHAQYPDFMEEWNPSQYSSQYFYQEMNINQVDGLGNIVSEKPTPYDVMVTFNDEKNIIQNFDIGSTQQGIKTLIRYNEMTSGSDILVLQYCYEEKSGFAKMTAREFEQEYGIIETRPGVRENMDNNYVWVNTDLDKEKMMSEVLLNFNHPSVYPDYSKKDFESSTKE